MFACEKIGSEQDHAGGHAGIEPALQAAVRTTSLLKAGGMERFYETEGYEAGSNVLRMVGYFSLVGLLRVHTLVGDYGGALAALAPIHPFQRTHLFTPKIAGAPQWVR